MRSLKGYTLGDGYASKKRLGRSGPRAHAIWLPHNTFFIFISAIFFWFAELYLRKQYRERYSHFKQVYIP